MSAPRPKTSVRALAGLVTLGVLASPVLVSQTADAATRAPQFRTVSAPNVFYPVRGTKAVKDMRTSTKRHAGTDIKAACNAPVYASHPGTARVLTGVKWAGKTLVQVSSNKNGLVTGYAYLDRSLVTTALRDGQCPAVPCR